MMRLLEPSPKLFGSHQPSAAVDIPLNPVEGFLSVVPVFFRRVSVRHFPSPLTLTDEKPRSTPRHAAPHTIFISFRLLSIKF